MVEASDRERIGIAEVELQKLMNDKKLKNVPLLVLANKQDQEVMSL